MFVYVCGPFGLIIHPIVVPSCMIGCDGNRRVTIMHPPPCFQSCLLVPFVSDPPSVSDPRLYQTHLRLQQTDLNPFKGTGTSAESVRLT